MGNLGKITSVKKTVETQYKSLAKCLSDRGRNSQEGTSKWYSPHKEKGGIYRNGLDENANYIKLMSPEEADQERAYVRSLKEKAEKMFANVSLEPNSTFYTEMTKRWGEDDVCKFAKLADGDNIFDLDNPYELTVYAYLRVHPKVAPSGEALYSGKYPKVEFYVNDSDIETKMAYKRKSKLNKAFATLEGLSTTKRAIIGRQCGLPIKESSEPEEVYNLLFDFIAASKIAATSGNVDTFNKFTEMKDEHLDVRNTLDLALAHNVYRKSKQSIFSGENLIGKNKQEAIEYLSDINNQNELLAIKEQIKMKKTLKSV